MTVHVRIRQILLTLFKVKIMLGRRTQEKPIQQNVFLSHCFSKDELFSEQQIDPGAILKIVEAGQFSFSGNQRDVASYAIVQDADRLHYLADYARLLRDMNQPSKDSQRRGSYLSAVEDLDAKPFHGASALILACSNLQPSFKADSFWRSVEQMVIAIRTLNLGVFLLDHELSTLNMEVIKSELGIPGTHTILAALAIGANMQSKSDLCTAKQAIWAWK